MRKKIINGLLLAVTFVAMSALVSCKDYESDYFAEQQGQIDDLNYLLSTLKAQQIAALSKEVKDLEDELAKLRTKTSNSADSLAAVTAEIEETLAKIKSCDCKPVDLQGIRDTLAILENKKANLADMLAADALLQQAIDALAEKEHQDSIDLAKAIDDANKQALAAAALATQAIDLAKGKADTAVVNALSKTVDSLSDAVKSLDARVTAVEKAAADALALATRDSLRLDAVEKGLQGALERIGNNEKAIEQLTKDMEQAQKDIAQNAQDLADAKKKYDTALKVINEALASLQEQINQLASKEGLTMKEVQDYLTPIVNGLENEIKAVQDDLDDLKKKLNKAIDALKHKITSIELQATYSPVAGYFAFPIGIQSNILAAYYGTPVVTNANGEVEFPTDRKSLYVFEDEVISPEAFTVLGKTNDDVITKTAFDKYIMDEEEGNAGTLYMTINPADEDFSGITPKLVNSRDVESGMTLSAISKSNKILYFGGTRPEPVKNGFYEAKATLSPDKVENVLTKFNLNDNSNPYTQEIKQVAKDILNNFNPNNVSTLKDINLTEVYYAVEDLLKDMLVRTGVKVEWEDTLGTHSVYSKYDIAATAIEPLSFNFLCEGSNVMDDFSEKLHKFTPIGTLKEDIDLYSLVANPYKECIIQVDTDGDGVFEDYTVKGIEGLKVLISKLNGESQVVTVSSLVEDIKEQIESEENKVISNVNKVVNRLKYYLKNPNHYLQPFLAYSNKGTYYHMSMSKAVPTEFVFDGGSGIELFPTSYTAEIFAPAFQKFVAVTNVFAPDYSSSAQDNEPTCLALANYANENSYNMNTVIPGKQTGIIFVPDLSNKEGYIYEITYAAVDYQGYNVAKKFYVRVK